MLPLAVPCKLLFKICSALTSFMTSSICHHFFLYSHGYGQYFPWSNFKKKNILVFSSLSSFRLGLSPYRLGEKGAPYFTGENFHNVVVNLCHILRFSTKTFLIRIASCEILIGLKILLYTTPLSQFRASSQSSAID